MYWWLVPLVSCILYSSARHLSLIPQELSQDVNSGFRFSVHHKTSIKEYVLCDHRTHEPVFCYCCGDPPHKVLLHRLLFLILQKVACGEVGYRHDNDPLFVHEDRSGSMQGLSSIPGCIAQRRNDD